GRLCFPRALVEDVIAGAGRNFMLYARDPMHDLDISGTRVHFGASGVAVLTLDFATGRFRPSTMLDLYDFARLVDTLEHVHFFNRPVFGRDLADPFMHDVNMAYVCAAGTRKHIAIGFTAGAHVTTAAEMYDMIAGGTGRFRARPFCSVGSCPIVSPLRFAAENCDVAMAAARYGFPVNMIIAGQAGATAPAALAGTLVQTTAETMAGLIVVNLIAPGHPVIFSNWPFVSDLRTGAFTGGGGEEAVMTAASAQISQFYDLPSGVGAGMADAKIPDNQAGYEKGITTALAGLAGANLIYESAGMLASLMACSFEAYVIDNDMLGNVLRAVRGIEVTDETLSFEVIRAAVEGPGHYLGSVQTLALMKSEFVYPRLSDRSRPEEWETAGAHDIRDRARKRVRGILCTHYPTYIDPDIDAEIRRRFPIVVPAAAMRPGNGRW
ncbi:MAG: trimethylamine methyltransferase family protein, partial [Dongiaceae bacterium]